MGHDPKIESPAAAFCKKSLYLLRGSFYYRKLTGQRGTAIKKHTFAVIGLGRFGATVATDLARFGNHVIGIDQDEKLVTQVADQINEAVICDARDEMALKEAGVSSFDAAVIAIGTDLEASILCLMNLQSLGIERITVKAYDSRHARILKGLGATDVLIPEEAAGERIAQRLHNPLMISYMHAGSGSYVALTNVHDKFVDKTVEQINAKTKQEARCIGVLRGDEYINPAEVDQCVLDSCDRLLIRGSRKAISRFSESR